MVISSRTPEGQPNRCVVCGFNFHIEPALLTSDAPCPSCGHLLWFSPDKVVVVSDSIEADIESLLQLDTDALTQRLMLDFEHVQFMSSSTIAKLVILNNVIKASQGELVLCNVSENILEVFRITKLSKLLNIIEHQ